MMEPQQTQKLKELDTAVFGNKSQQIPGLLSKNRDLDLMLNGDGITPGLVGKVAIMWRVHVWLMFGFGGIFGSVMTMAIQRFF